MKRIVIFLLSLVAVISLIFGSSHAFAQTEHGYLKGTGDSSSFTITSPGGNTTITFSYPKGKVEFWVSVTDLIGTVSRYNLDNWEAIIIHGAGVFTVTVYSRKGAGTWSADYVLGGRSVTTPDIGSLPSSPSSPTEGGPPRDSREVSISGRLSGPGDTHVFRVPAQSSYTEVVFYYAKETMSLSVRVVGNDKRTVLGDFDLDKGEVVELYGEGYFYLTVYSKKGAGGFIASFNPAGSPIPDSYIIAKGELKGNMDKREFVFEAKTDGIGIYFDCPSDNSDFWVKVAREDSKALLGDFSLKDEKIVDLKKKGKYVITIYSRGGTGSFTAFYFGGPPAETVALGTSPPESDVPSAPLPPKFPPFPDAAKLPPGTSFEKGYLSDKGDFETFIVNAKTDYVEVTFSYPKGIADFWVKVIGGDGIEVLGDFDLDQGEIIQLMGAGTFYIKVYSKSGAGNWSAVYNEGTESPSIGTNGISNRPRYTY